MGMILHLNGWPGVGKYTIGRAVAHRLGARLVDNHLLHDVAIGYTGVDDPDRWQLYEAVRDAAYAALSRRPISEIFVLTNALCVGSKRERAEWNHVVDLAIARQVPLLPIVLLADIDENVRRIEGRERSDRKLKDGARLREFIASDFIQRPDVPDLIELDVTCLLADEAAEQIATEIAMRCEQGLLHATVDHRRLKGRPCP